MSSVSPNPYPTMIPTQDVKAVGSGTADGPIASGYNISAKTKTS